MTRLVATTFCLLLFIHSTAHSITVRAVEVATGFNSPLFVTAPGDRGGRIFVVSQNGQVYVVRNGAALPTPFLDVSSLLIAGGERGLLGFAFHPNYTSNGLFYVSYTRVQDGANIIAQGRVSANPDVAEPAVSTILGPVTQPQPNHNGGMIAFGPDGYLYIGIGDGGNGDDIGPGHTPDIGNAQDITNLLGKILRIDVNQPQDTNLYTIPPDNPFVSPTAGARPEIYAYGLRNPWRFSFDRVRRTLVCGDVGQGLYEEIDLIENGKNYGWHRMEGLHCKIPSSNCDNGMLTLPTFEYPHAGDRCSVTGGYVYRGFAYPSLRGLYFYGDLCTGEIWTLREISPGVYGDSILRVTIPGQISSFGEDDNGEIYVCGHNVGIIYRLIDAEPQSLPIPTNIWEYLLDIRVPAAPLEANSDSAIDIADLLFTLLR